MAGSIQSGYPSKDINAYKIFEVFKKSLKLDLY